jgi:hypothetical protein
MLQIWTEPSGYKFTNNGQPFNEQVSLSIALPVANATGVTYSVISGNLPGGLYISGSNIIGSPYIVSNLISYQFCIRGSATATSTSSTFDGGTFAPGGTVTGTFLVGMTLTGVGIPSGTYIVSSNNNGTFAVNITKNLSNVSVTGSGFADRTFLMQVNGANGPEFITAAGNLPVGVNQQLYALDETYVSYQIEAFDFNVALGDNLKFFIETGDGILPPGLTLSDSGVISGYIQQNPETVITPDDGSGAFDDTYYDDAGYDFALIPTDGFDSYQYDDVTWDYSSPAVLPSSLNQNYQFKVTVTDGTNFAQRIFKIFVVGTDQFRADSTSLDGFAGSFTADSTFLRNPVWLSAANLGTFRANNYLTVPVVLYDNNNVLLRLETTNCEVYAVTKRVALTDNIINSTNITVTNVTTAPVRGQYFTFDNYITGATEQIYQISSVTDLGNSYYRLTVTTPLLINLPDLVGFYIGTLSELPPGTAFDVNTGEIFGRVPYQPAITEQYIFTITAVRQDPKPNETEYVTTFKTFNIVILGSVTSQISWTSPNNLGTIPANYICTLSVDATSNVPNASVLYYLTSGSLPPGLTLDISGEILGTPNQYYNASTGLLGLTTFDGGTFTLDKNLTTIDRTYTFTVTASDQYQYSALAKTFAITISTPNTVAYSNIITQPFLAPTQRSAWRSFITNDNVFTPTSIYRINDDNFGVQTNLQMLVYAGIETEVAAAYVGAMGLGFKKKRFKFGSIGTATAVDPTTGENVYEVVYVQMIDPYPSTQLSIKTASIEPETITVDNNDSVYDTYRISVDSTGYEVSNPNTDTYFPSSINNWQTRLSAVGLSERNYLPLWMRSIPTGQKAELGYVLCVPLCYCKPGTSRDIVENITSSGFNFNTIDYTVDRFTISAVTGYTSDKYLIFRDNRITV